MNVVFDSKTNKYVASFNGATYSTSNYADIVSIFGTKVAA